MTAWKEGKKPEDLKPQIIGRDSDWDSGLKLESFELLPNDYSDGPNLHITVRRTVKDDKGRASTQDVPYTVTTSSTILVFRSDD